MSRANVRAAYDVDGAAERLTRKRHVVELGRELYELVLAQNVELGEAVPREARHPPAVLCSAPHLVPGSAGRGGIREPLPTLPEGQGGAADAAAFDLDEHFPVARLRCRALADDASTVSAEHGGSHGDG
jgi:hypothetical protein